MSAVGLRAAPLQAADEPLKKGKSSAAAPRRAALGEITNNTGTLGDTKVTLREQNPLVLGPNRLKFRRMGSWKKPSKPSCSQKPSRIPEATARVTEPLPALPENPSLEMERELCRAFSETLLPVPDVDEQDAAEPQLCSHYVKDIYAYLQSLEVQQAIRADYLKGSEVTAAMRAILVDWLIQVHSRFQLLQETLYLTVAVLDRFLQVSRTGTRTSSRRRVQPVSRRKLQLVGVAAMLVACKYEEMFCPEVGDFAYITDDAFSKAQILEMEQLVLRKLGFQLGRPLPLHFLRRASKVANFSRLPENGLGQEFSRVLVQTGSVVLTVSVSQTDLEKHTLAKYLMELTLLDYQMVHLRPSEVAAASLCLSQLLVDGLSWSATQQHYSSYDEAHLQPIMQQLAKNVVLVNEGRTKFQAVRKKYSSSKLMKISLLPQLNSSIIQKLAAPLLTES
ncbi:hypothetical protein CCH79_00018910 [Gambusia affinis]|uniref:G2/mitotic-specific cyclin-B2 n=1 Tax=Gambusia affinis TaxID=33528 RepID=A0A315VLP4_GAMAF|nr:hypothetical protein CCH79_00018910 [Gambusia affinis]